MRFSPWFRATVWVLAAMVAAGAGVGCAGKKKDKKAHDPHRRYAKFSNEQLYGQALHSLRKKRHTKTQARLDAILARPADPVYTPLAHLRKADSMFIQGGDEGYVNAGHEYRKFLRQFPRHEEGAYAQYQAGMCYFKRLLSPERDPQNTLRAMEAFEKVVRLYPDSIHVHAAKERIALCRRNLAEREFLIGKFYYQQVKYQAALDRFERMMEKYPGLYAGVDLDYYMGETLWALDRREEGGELLRRVVAEHPKTPYAKAARERLAGKSNRMGFWDRVLPPYL
jgi:outer membrane assembly lipoprotein YfiO